MPRPTGISVKSIGLIAASALALIFGIIIWVSVSSTQSPTPRAHDYFPTDQSEIPNIEETQTGGAMLVTMVDKNDPTRTAATLKADRFEPIGEGKRRLDNPVSWIYLHDGRAVKVTADYATMLMPNPNEPPESGTLEGNILIEAFETSDQNAPSILKARFDQPVEFERRYLRLRSAGRFEITSPGFDLIGSDLTIILNELRDRVELIDIAHGEQIVIHTNATTKTNPNPQDSDPSTSPPNTNAPSVAKDSKPAGKPTAPVRLERYHIKLADNVLASVNIQDQGAGTASADRIDVWATLVDGSIPADALRPIRFAKSQTNQPQQPTTPSTPSPTVPTTSAPAVASNPDSIVITWSGKLTVRPVDEQIPEHLADSKLSLVLSGNPESGVKFTVPDQGFVGQAFAATYHATQGLVELISDQTEAGIIKLTAQGAGSLMASSLKADLVSGRITLDDRGQLTSTPKDTQDPASHSSIQWLHHAAFDLDIVQGELTDRLTSAEFKGAVVAKQAGHSIGARTLVATLDPTKPSSESLTKLSIDAGVMTSASRSILTATTIDIDFESAPHASTPDPKRIIAKGQVFARNKGAQLKADELEASMFRDLSGELAIGQVQTQGNITFADTNNTRAKGDQLDLDGPNEAITLLGAPAAISQGGSTVLGDHINLNAKDRMIEVLGPGSFDHDIAINDDSQPTGHIHATWKGSMRFDDALGSVLCQDDVRVVSTPNASTRDTLSAHRALIKLAPLPSADPIAADQSQTQPSDDRQLLSARIFGHAPTGQDPVPAKIESRTYAQDDPERVIGLIYLEGAQILADNQAQTLEVPSPGTLLIMDRSQDQSSAQPAASNSSSNGSDLTRFSWQGRMNFDRTLGNANFQDEVIVRQKTIATGKIVQLSTDRLDARFTRSNTALADPNSPDSTQAEPQTIELIDAVATGTVRFLFENKELLADNAVYDALADSLFASAIDNKLVTLYDENQPAPMSAKTMRWNLSQDRIEINAPTPTRTPSGG